MRNRAIALCCTLFFAASSPAADLQLKIEKLAGDVYLFRAPSDLDMWTATNVVAVVNDRDVTVFDTCTRPVTARMVIAEIRKITDKPVRTIVNSHWHMDHWMGNAEFVKAYPGVEIIATEETRGYMQRMGNGFFADSIGRGLARARTALDEAIKSGSLTDAVRREKEQEIADTETFQKEIAEVPHILPTVVYRDSMKFWRGKREFQLMSVVGDATGSTAMYLPAERILVTGDALVRPENREGPPPWTTNSYAIKPWLDSLRRFQALDARVIVPGQGGALHDETYLDLTAQLFASIIEQVHAAMERGITKLPDIQAAVNVDAIGVQYTPGAVAPHPSFKPLVATLTRKAAQEALDGVER
jgi:glyoxylase-like metal-dependent hydrolase (beta-lactamase superfamily II)